MSRHRSSEEYDAIIIGAGIGGLVCGCYLAKAGMKVLICEQHHKPGGYCTSFKRKGFTFDAAPHCFGSYREDGIMRKILNDLGVDSKLNIIRANPSDIIITPDFKVSFSNDLEQTIDEFQNNFPNERNLRKFFYLLLDTDPQSFSKLRRITFRELLDQYFVDEKLKSILSLPFFGIGGLPSFLISAFVGAKLFSEFLLDGGYYPIGGMQALPDALAEKFKEFGGEIHLSTLVKKIAIKENKVTGVVLQNKEYIPAKYVISNCDARQTYLKLIGKEKLPKEFYEKLNNMIPSFSNFLIYIGLASSFKPKFNPGSVLYYFTTYSIENIYSSIKNGNFKNYCGLLLRVSHDKSTIFAGIPVIYKSKKYWKNYKSLLLETFIEKMKICTSEDLLEHIVHKEAATPLTLEKYTLNYKGASFGWSSIPSQFGIPEFRRPSFIQNLYLTGHWTTFGVGISGTAYIGCDTAKILLRKGKMKSHG
ncbi:MAG TPA: NAD(P)/FAD-dependent oxidoreductase [Nitrospirae bacterium]|nr:NAD(P)/FAD-dependent oxidoreductase [Nitrospirota bacterium]